MNKTTCQIKTFSVGQLATNCYIVLDVETKDAVIIDPGDDGNYVAEKILSFHMRPHAILITHGHFDHILGARELQEIFHLPVHMNVKDDFLVKRMKESAEYHLHRKIVEQNPKITSIATKQLKFGSVIIDVIETPGHTPGGLSFTVKDTNAVFTGDTVFAHGYIGRTDLSYSKPLALAESIQTLFTLPFEYVIYPGHGDISTIGEEKRLHEKGKEP